MTRRSVLEVRAAKERSKALIAQSRLVLEESRRMESISNPPLVEGTKQAGKPGTGDEPN